MRKTNAARNDMNMKVCAPLTPLRTELADDVKSAGISGCAHFREFEMLGNRIWQPLQEHMNTATAQVCIGADFGCGEYISDLRLRACFLVTPLSFNVLNEASVRVLWWLFLAMGLLFCARM
jgi:hypothetical protein